MDQSAARCMDLAGALPDRFGLLSAEVVRADPDVPGLLTDVAIAAAAEQELALKSADRRIVSLGTGRALKATVEQWPRMGGPQHVVVSRPGHMLQEGSASPFDAPVSLTERIGVPHYPLPVLARGPA